MGARRPVFIWDGPGNGKSSVFKQPAASLNLPLQDVRALLLDPVGLRSLPFLGSDSRSKWAAKEFLRQDGSGILFLGELNAAPARVQASCYQLVLDRKLGEYTLPEGWAIIAAGNCDPDRAATTQMQAPSPVAASLGVRSASWRTAALLRGRFQQHWYYVRGRIKIRHPKAVASHRTPELRAILLNPTQEPVPDNAAAWYAVASALARSTT